ncbi:Tfp pilus assembly protein FimT/FimU [Myxococcus sp. RHSTA-1-4]|uniref:pilus assembly FimT family protein n=1 Tax=Myxococcus sp. RHSTA-1-4 TaxID=2874601 RepID=UPI00272E855D|nr:type II secretion system protein [Myxococcus sp. RHSTA-1-4]MBZ4419018.1 type II secretion system GspH family protein [Myxococcus sp. RHSTA-1-4]
MRRRGSQGFTLLEMMVVVAIIGILASLSVTTLSRMQPRLDVMGALDDLSATLSQAQARAQARGGDVWVVFLPTGTGASTREQGGFIVYEDLDRDLDFSALDIGDDGKLASAPEAGDQVLTETWFGHEPFRGRVQLALDAAQVFSLNAPFSGAAAACNFCSNTGGSLRGAIVFQADGEVRLVDGSGLPVANLNAGVVTLSSDSERGALAIAPATGFTRVTRP